MMLSKLKARQTGRRIILWGVVAGLFVTTALLSGVVRTMEERTWSATISSVFRLYFRPGGIIGMSTLFVCGYFLGPRAGVEILIRRRSASLTGIKYSC